MDVQYMYHLPKWLHSLTSLALTALRLTTELFLYFSADFNELNESYSLQFYCSSFSVFFRQFLSCFSVVHGSAGSKIQLHLSIRGLFRRPQ